jgi:hypothetical protein
VIHLKRFQRVHVQYANYWTKRTKLVTFPIRCLDLSASIACKALKSENWVYDLCAVLVSSTTPSSSSSTKSWFH